MEVGVLGKLPKIINLMKNYMYIVYIFFVLFSCNNSSVEKEKNEILKTEPILQEISNANIDSLKASISVAIIRGQLLNFEGGDKYHYSNISVNEVLLNKSNHNFGESIRVAHYNWSNGIPKNKDCIIYIVPWPLGSKTLNEKEEWMLIEGDGDYACECK